MNGLNLKVNIEESRRYRLFIIGDDRLKLASTIAKMKMNIPLSGIDIYDPKGKIDFVCGKLYKIRKEIVESFWIELGLEEFIRSPLLKKEKMNELNIPGEDAEALKEEMTNVIEAVIDTYDNDFSRNQYMTKWLEKVRNLNAAELSKEYPDVVIPELVNFVEGLPSTVMENQYLFIVVSNKIIVNNMWNDLLDYIYNTFSRMLIYESTKDRLSIEQLLVKSHYTGQFNVLELRATKKYVDKLIRIHY